MRGTEKPLAWVGIDTSNYTTSAAACVVGEGGRLAVIANCKAPLLVEAGARGLRQSDAVFAHTRNLPGVLRDLRGVLEAGGYEVASVGVSATPRDAEGSYMPCFLTGIAAAEALAAGAGCGTRRFSHQSGHIMAALYSSGALFEEGFFGAPFLAFHVSGGTTEAVVAHPRLCEEDPASAVVAHPRLCEEDPASAVVAHPRLCEEDPASAVVAHPHATEATAVTGFDVELVGGGADLHAGQVIDRVGVLMGLDFPCGRRMEELAVTNRQKLPPIKICVRDGQCHLSGLENQAAALWKQTGDGALVSAFVLTFIGRTLRRMTEQLQEMREARGEGYLPVVYAGGVMSNHFIRPLLTDKAPWRVYFSEPAYSADNAAGVALLCAMAQNG